METNEMNKDTPETDAKTHDVGDSTECLMVSAEVARKLERERDEARTTIEDAKRALNATAYEGILLATMRVKEERDEARELVKYYQEYSKLLIGEINDTAALAHVCGWRSNRYEQGKVLREKIKQLEESNE